MPTQRKLRTLVGFALKSLRLFRLMKRRSAARERLYLANMEIAKLDPTSELYAQRVRELNEAMVQLYLGKWYATVATQRGERAAWRKASAAFQSARQTARLLLRALQEGSDAPLILAPTQLTSQGTEIEFAGDVPLVPEITPIVVLQGSDYEMGAQYARQLVQIFGPWILLRHTGRTLSEEERTILRRWESEHQKHTPWLMEFCRGWAAGANELGIPMTYEEVLDLWVGHKPPAEDFLDSGKLPEIPPMAACSGLAAWGSATKDGALITGSSGDHDLSYQVTIVAFPDEGNPFIYSPFGATGEITGIGAMWFFGHPAINGKGLAYVHHGGGPKFLEPRRAWGYGIRRAASVIHILRFCDTAKQAREKELSWPIGDVGLGDQATVGGFWADSQYGYIVEGRRSPEAIRESGILGERDFLYANNSVAHPNAIEAEWMSADKPDWMWDEHGGWRPKVPKGMTKSLGLLLSWATGRMSARDMLRKGMMFAYTNSCARNRAAFRMLNERHGTIDIESMKEMYRTGGTLPEGPWRRIEREYTKSGAWGEISFAHGSNAITVVTKPSEGLYCLCTGPARRGMAPMMPSSNITIHAETNAFWEVRLGRSPQEMMEYVRAKAKEHIATAQDALATTKAQGPLQRERELLGRAVQELAEGEALCDGSLEALAKATRAYTRAQVRALQVVQALA